jgi:hypothetical protein
MGSYHFEKDSGGEQSYGVISGCDTKEMISMIEYAKERNLDLVAVMDAECDVVMITTKRIADLLLPILNSAHIKPLEALNYIEGSEHEISLRYKED